jgi:hypothetical protein
VTVVLVAGASGAASAQSWIDVLGARGHDVFVVAPPAVSLHAEHHVAAMDDTADTVRAVADVMEGVAAPVLLLDADVASPAASVLALEQLVAEPGTVALVTSRTPDGGGRQPGRLQVVADVVVAAGSTRHAIGAWTHVGAGLLRIDGADVGAVARALRVMAEVAAEHEWHDPPWSLIVVAAVRAGVVVRIAAADRPPAPLPWDEGEREGLDAAAELDLRLAAASGAAHGVVDRVVAAPAARAVARRLWRGGIGADAVTAVSVAAALLAGMLVASGTRPAAAVAAGFLLVSVLLDRVDGMVARATHTASPFGAWLDATGDRLREAALVIGLAVATAQLGDPRWALASGVLALLALAHLAGAAGSTASGWGGAPAPVRIPLDRLDEPALPNLPPAEGRGAPAWLPFSVSRGDGAVLTVLGLVLLSPDTLLVVLAVIGAASAVACLVLVGSPRPLPAAQRQLWELADPGPLGRVVVRQDPQLSVLRRLLATPVAAWVPPLTWALEAGGVVAVVLVADADAVPITLAWIGVLAFHRLDLATRLRALGHGPPAWLGVVGLGALGRLLLVVLLAGADLLTVGLAVGSVVLGVLYAAESAGRFADRR